MKSYRNSTYICNLENKTGNKLCEIFRCETLISCKGKFPKVGSYCFSIFNCVIPSAVNNELTCDIFLEGSFVRIIAREGWVMINADSNTWDRVQLFSNNIVCV